MYFLKLVEGISFLPMVYPKPAVCLLWLQKGWATPCACPQHARQSWDLLATSEWAAADSPRRLKLEPAVQLCGHLRHQGLGSACTTHASGWHPSHSTPPPSHTSHPEPTTPPSRGRPRAGSCLGAYLSLPLAQGLCWVSTSC